MTRTFLFLCAGIALLIANAPSSYGFAVHRLTLTSPRNSASSFLRENADDGDRDGMIEFSDFGDFVPGDSSSSSVGVVSQKLQERVNQVRQTQIQQDAKIHKNWSMGNWKVRGFSLDKYSAKDRTSGKDSGEISISHLVKGAGEEDETIVVGRTDGSVCIVALGTAYWTHFQSTLTAVETSNETVSIQSKLVRDDELPSFVQQQQQEGDDNPQQPLPSVEVPFHVVHQFMAHKDKEITSLLTIDHDDLTDVLVRVDDVNSGASSTTMVFTGDESGLISVWSIPEEEEDRVLPIRNLEAHSDQIVALKAVSLVPSDESPSLLFSASIDGTLALWDLWTGDLVYQCEMVEEEKILCADVYENQVFLGLASGEVMAYCVHDMVQTASEGGVCPVPNGRFHASSSAVTSIVCGGAGRLNQGKSSVLVTGGADGSVKQWELLQRTTVNDDDTSATILEHWPRLPTQRMPKRAHVFRGHDEQVTALVYHDATKIISASADGTVRAWCPKTGNELYLMDGFDSSLTSLVVNDNVLVTNGMKQFVCVHDFDVDLKDYDEGLDLEW